MRSKQRAVSISLIGTAVLAAVAMSAAASEQGIFTKEWQRSLQSLKMMDMMDGNKDHRVTKEEFMAYQSRIFDMMDRNKDGMVDRSEWQGKLGGIGGKGTS